MSKVKQDDQGLYIITGGYTFRPGGVRGHDHAVEMDDGGLKKGDTVKARHIGGSQLAKITLENGDVKYWHNAPLDSPNRRENIEANPLPPVNLRQLIGIENKQVKSLTRYEITLLYTSGVRVQLGPLQAVSYEEAARQAKTKLIPQTLSEGKESDFAGVVVIGPEYDMVKGRSVRRYDYTTLQEQR